MHHELALALLAHYAVGVAFAALYLFATQRLGMSPLSVFPALTFGLITSLFPLFQMFPAMGFGWFGMRGAGDTSLLMSSLTGHAGFGLGIWLGVRAAWLSMPS
jgi:hypothetical protein